MKVRRVKCRLPETVTFKTKIELAVGMFERVSAEGVIPFRYVAADTAYGRNIEFIEAIEKKELVLIVFAI
jgi:SRSO17 transposase